MPDLQTDAERAATNTIHWLQSCNAYVVLDSGGVYTAFATLPNLLHACYYSLALLTLCPYAAYASDCSPEQCLALLCITYITVYGLLCLTCLSIQVLSRHLHCWTAS